MFDPVIYVINREGLNDEVLDEFKRLLEMLVPGKLQLVAPEDSESSVMRSTQLNALAEMVHKNAIEHGWWEDDRSFGELMALVHSEVSEALEFARDGHQPDEIFYSCDCLREDRSSPCCVCGQSKIDGIPVELADVIIRVLDICGRYHIDIGHALFRKMFYNKYRPYKHGGKVF